MIFRPVSHISFLIYLITKKFYKLYSKNSTNFTRKILLEKNFTQKILLKKILLKKFYSNKFTQKILLEKKSTQKNLCKKFYSKNFTRTSVPPGGRAACGVGGSGQGERISSLEWAGEGQKNRAGLKTLPYAGRFDD